MSLDKCSLAYSLVKERYEFELRRQNELNNIVSIPIGIISALVGFAAYIIKTLPDQVESNFFYYGFYFFFFLSIASFFCCIFFLYKHQKGLPYAYIASPDAIYNFEKDYKRNFRKAGARISYSKINHEVSKFMFKLYADCAKKNIDSNRKKNYYYRCLIGFTLVTLVLLVFAFGFKFFINGGEEPAVKVESVSPISIKASDLEQFKSKESMEVKIRQNVHFNFNAEIDEKRKKTTNKGVAK